MVELIEESEDSYIYKVLNSNFIVDKRYELLDVVGTGAYGIVVSAKDKIGKEAASNLVAIKKMEKTFEHPTFTKRTLRELKILRLVQHENIIGLHTIELPQSKEFTDVYVVCELMETDLSTIIKSNQQLTDEHYQFFLYQILRGMKFAHSARILHRDLKPRNLLVNSNCDLKICDFGLARPMMDKMEIFAPQMTDYVSTRWYRAPELLLSWKQYDTSVDVWSIGCIFAELLGRRPIFPGTDNEDQFKIILEVLGTPSKEEIDHVPRRKAQNYLRKLGNKNGKGLESLYPDINPMALDLLIELLRFDPVKRITIDQALAHPYLADLHYPPDEPVMTPVSNFDFDFERYTLKTEEIKELIHDEILLYHSPEKKLKYEELKTKYPQGMFHERKVGTLKRAKKHHKKKNNHKEKEESKADDPDQKVFDSK